VPASVEKNFPKTDITHYPTCTARRFPCRSLISPEKIIDIVLRRTNYVSCMPTVMIFLRKALGKSKYFDTREPPSMCDDETNVVPRGHLECSLWFLTLIRYHCKPCVCWIRKRITYIYVRYVTHDIYKYDLNQFIIIWMHA